MKNHKMGGPEPSIDSSIAEIEKELQAQIHAINALEKQLPKEVSKKDIDKITAIIDKID